VNASNQIRGQENVQEAGEFGLRDEGKNGIKKERK